MKKKIVNSLLLLMIAGILTGCQLGDMSGKSANDTGNEEYSETEKSHGEDIKVDPNSSNSDYIQTDEVKSADTAIKEVLMGEAMFVNRDNNDEDTYIGMVDNITGTMFDKYLIPARFTVVDMDQDGEKEVIVDLTTGTDGWNLVLHYHEGKVYGYGYVYRGMLNIGNDGRYTFSNGAADNGIAHLVFDGSSVTEEILAQSIGSSKEYYVLGSKVSEQEYIDYINSNNSNQAEWYDFTKENIEKYA